MTHILLECLYIDLKACIKASTICKGPFLTIPAKYLSITSEKVKLCKLRGFGKAISLHEM